KIVKTRKQKRLITEEINEIEGINQVVRGQKGCGKGSYGRGNSGTGNRRTGNRGKGNCETENRETENCKRGSHGSGTSHEGQLDNEYETSVEPSTQNIEPNDSYSNYEKEIKSVNSKETKT
ncbi:5749_t:CDS:2, partial [Cetraspora pellucida]